MINIANKIMSNQMVKLFVGVCVCVCKLLIYKLSIYYHLRLGIAAIAKPPVTSKPPTIRRYHFDGILMSNTSDSGNTFEYFTYSFRYRF